MLRNVLPIARETAVAFSLGRDLSSRIRLAADVLLSRFLKFGHAPGFDSIRLVRLHDGVSIKYRLNRGDVQGLREIWMDRAYRLPFDVRPRVIVDLGANIGLASVWFNLQFAPKQIVAVEADADNARLTIENFQLSQVPGDVVQAAISPEDGETFFESRDESNLGHVVRGAESSEAGRITTVKMISMRSVLCRLPTEARIDLLKMDIEGGEALLLSRNTQWLARVDAIITELHPDVVDCSTLVETIVAAGFIFIPANSVFPGNMTAFIRRDHPAAARFLNSDLGASPRCL